VKARLPQSSNVTVWIDRVTVPTQAVMLDAAVAEDKIKCGTRIIFEV
jgi:hypothetical protein